MILIDYTYVIQRVPVWYRKSTESVIFDEALPNLELSRLEARTTLGNNNKASPPLSSSQKSRIGLIDINYNIYTVIRKPSEDDGREERRGDNV